MSSEKTRFKRWLSALLCAALAVPVVTASVGISVQAASGAGTVTIDGQQHTLGVIGNFADWADNSDVLMTDEDGDGIFEAKISPEPGEYEFKVRADGKWDYTWSIYEADYDRTMYSQTNCKITVHDGESFVVRLDTTKVDDAAKANADSYVHDSYFDFEEEGYEYWPVTFEIVKGVLTNTSSISTKKVVLGNSVTVKCTAAGGNDDKQFTVLYQEPNSTKWKTASAYSAKRNVTFTPTLTGNYKIRVRVKDADGKTAAKDFTLNVRGTSEVLIDDELHTLGIVGDFTEWGGYDAEGNYVPDIPLTDKDGDGIFEAVVSPEAGEHYFKVRADQDWLYSWGVYEPEYDRTFNSQTIPAITVHDGESFIVKVDTTKVDDAAKLNADSYVNNPYFDFKDEGYEYWPVTFEIVGSALTNTSSISAKKVVLGNSVTIKCTAAGGNSDKQFTILYQEPNSTQWKTASAYSTKKEVSFQPTLTGDYKIRVRVKDADGKTAAKDFTLNVRSTSEVFFNNKIHTLGVVGAYNGWGIDFPDVPLTDEDGDGVFEAVVTPQSGGVYEFKVRADQEWSYAWSVYEPEYDRTLNSQTNCSITVPDGASFIVRFDTNRADEDAKGNLHSGVHGAYFDEQDLYEYWPVRAEVIGGVLTNTSSISARSVVLGSSVNIKCSATGGNRNKQFTVLYQEPNSTQWKTASAYSTKSTVNFRPTLMGNYKIRVRVKDADGKTAAKDFTLKVTAAALKNTSTISDQSVQAGKAITVNCASTGGNGEKQFTVLYQEPNSTQWKTASAYSTKTNVSFTPTLTGNYTFRVRVKDADGKTAAKDFTLTVKEGPLTNLSTVDIAAAVPGDTITINCSAAGGSGTKQFTVLYQKYGQTNWKTLSAYSTKKTVTFKPAAAGDYTIRVRVKDASGQTVANNYYISIVDEAREQYIFFDNSKTKWEEVYVYWESFDGEAVRDAEGELYGYREVLIQCSDFDVYEVTYEPIGYPGLPMQKVPGTNVWQVKLPYNADKIVFSNGKFYQDIGDVTVYSTEGVGFDDMRQAGQIYVPDTTQASSENNGKIVTYSEGSWQDYTGRFVPDNELKNLSTVNNWISMDEKFVVTFAAKGGFGEKQFAVYYKGWDDANWTKISGYCTQSEISFDPKEYASQIRVKVKDANGQVVTTDYQVYAYDSPVNLQKHSVGITGSFNNWGWDENWNYIPDVPMYDDDGDGIWEGTIHIDEVTEDMIMEAMTDAGAEGVVSRGFSGVQCKIRLDGAWNHCWGEYEQAYDRTYNSQTNFCVEATAGQSLTFRIFLDTNQVMSEEVAPDADDAYYVWRTGIVKEMENRSTIGSGSAVDDNGIPVITVGNTFNIKCKAENNVGDVQFMVLYYAASQNRWKTLSAYSDKTSVTFKPTTDDVYTVRVKAKDAQGNIAVKDFTVKAIQPITNNSLLGTNSIKLGSNVAIFCSAENGWGGYQYAVYYKKASSNTWTKLRGYDSSYVLSLTPKAAVDYDVRVDAKDVQGNVASTILSLNVTK